MRITTKGLVLREVKTRESDRILTILAPGHGVISASARGSMRPKSRLFSATGLFCYSEWTLFEGRTMYQVDEAAPQEVFFGLREDVESVSVAAYIAELICILSPTGEEAQVLLNLALNCFYVLAKHRAPAELVKAVFELRALAEAGFMPDVVCCEECGRYEGGQFRFGPHHGTLLCAHCAAQKGRQPNLDGASLAALRHIVLAEPKRVFSFALKGNSIKLLCGAAESFVLCHLDYAPKSLAFLKTILIQETGHE